MPWIVALIGAVGVFLIITGLFADLPDRVWADLDA